MKSAHDRVVASLVYEHRFGVIHRKGGGVMTAYEIISVFIGMLALLMSFGGWILALLTFLDKRNKRK